MRSVRCCGVASPPPHWNLPMGYRGSTDVIVMSTSGGENESGAREGAATVRRHRDGGATISCAQRRAVRRRAVVFFRVLFALGFARPLRLDLPAEPDISLCHAFAARSAPPAPLCVASPKNAENLGRHPLSVRRYPTRTK